MINCPQPQLENIHNKLQQILQTISPKQYDPSPIPTKQTLLQAITSYVDTIFNELVQINKHQLPQSSAQKSFQGKRSGLADAVDQGFLKRNGQGFRKNYDLQSQMYQQIEKDLQKQENLNRLLIKKQLEFKEYQKCLEEELKEERHTAKKLQGKIQKFSSQIVHKDMDILHMSNEKNRMGKERKTKDVITMDTLLNDKRITQALKVYKETGPSKQTHLRRKSDEICRRPSTAASKRKGSVSKR